MQHSESFWLQDQVLWSQMPSIFLESLLGLRLGLGEGHWFASYAELGRWSVVNSFMPLKQTLRAGAVPVPNTRKALV